MGIIVLEASGEHDLADVRQRTVRIELEWLRGGGDTGEEKAATCND
jgi:hypothetical protein